jgi:hypothetical protein
MRALVIALLLASSAAARAQAPGDTPAMTFAPPDTVAPPVDATEALAHQPLAERALFTGTALTTPSSTADVSARAVLGAGYVVDAAIGLGRTTELWVEAGQTRTLGMTSPLSSYGGPQLGTQALGLKQVLARNDRWQIAVEASLRRSDVVVYATPASNGMPPFVPSSPSSSDILIGAAAYASVCVDARCRALVTATGSALWNTAWGSTAVPFFSASAIVGGDHLRGLAEMLATPDQSNGTIRSMLLLGARYGWTHFAIEGGVAVGTDDEDSGIAPLLGISARL